tara:strand:+ start:115 stop:462 length:348 start_codon:yes stop_codon:yes gene_type:complete
MIKYKIVEVNAEQHSIVVRFYSDVITEESLAVQWGDEGQILRGRTDYNIDLPIPAPSGDELQNIILSNAPSQWLKNQELILDPAVNTSLEDVKALVGIESVEPVAEETIFPVSSM